MSSLIKKFTDELKAIEHNCELIGCSGKERGGLLCGEKKHERIRTSASRSDTVHYNEFQRVGSA